MYFHALRRAFAPVLVFLALPLSAAKILFDASHREMAGNADWVADADAWNLPLPAYGTCPATTNESNPVRFPTPPQAGITPATLETYWTGAASAMAVALAKAGHDIENLPPGAALTYGNGGNPQDLSNYKVFIIPEPQQPFSAAEKTALLAFVSNGGGLFMIGDHENSDRDCDGNDSPAVYNDLTGATATTGGVFGIWFHVGSPTKGSESWYDEGVNSNVSPNPADAIINGPFGSGAGGLGLFGATSMELFPAANATVAGHVWRNSQTARDNSRVTFATAQYGSGRVAAIGDSSPLDDGTGDPSDSLYGGWDKATGGVANAPIHLNAVAWLLNAAPDTTPPAITGGPSAAASDCSATVSWTTDEPASSLVNYGPTTGYGSSQSVSGFVQSHAVTLSGLTAASPYHYKVSSSDSAGNGPTQSGDALFATTAATAPLITAGPAASPTGFGAVVTWTTNEPSDSRVDYGTTAAYGSSATNAALVTSHSITLTGLTADSLYHYQVGSTDGCGNGPVNSADATFTTGAPQLDLSGWVLEQFNSAQTFTFPAGTQVASGGYLVLARDSAQPAFETFFGGPLPAGAAFLNSNATGSCSAGCFPQVNGGESYRLKDNLGAIKDGTTITFAATAKANQRTAPGAPAGTAGSWAINPVASANPGSGAGSGSGAGLVINEVADPSDYTKEYVELFYDAGAADVVPPAPINPLAAAPTGATAVQLTFTAVGNDGTTGTASSYMVRRSPLPIRTEAEFFAATAVSGLPAPKTAGQAESIAVTGLTANTVYCFAIKAVDGASNAGGLSNSPCATTGPTGGGGGTHLVISQIQTAGDGGTPADDEFVEIFNPTSTSQSLSGKSLQYKSFNGTTHTAFALPNFTMPAGSWYLVARSVYNGTPVADATNGTFLMAAGGGHVFLVNQTTALTASSCSTDAAIIDKVGYGTGNCPETTVAAAPASNNSIVRTPTGSDTDNNSVDFTISTPSVPHSSVTPPVGGGSLGIVGPSLYLSGGAATRLDWGAAFGATSYHLYRGATAASLSLFASPAGNTSTDNTAPSPAWFYRVLAYNGSAESAD
jgi:hypothetical protein